MGMIIFDLMGGRIEPLPGKEAKREYYFSQEQNTEWRKIFFTIFRKEPPAKLMILNDGRVMEFSEENIVGWAKHRSREPHHLRFKDSVFLGAGKTVEKEDIDQVLESLAETL